MRYTQNPGFGLATLSDKHKQATKNLICQKKGLI